MLKSNRLRKIAENVRENEPMADIGADRALLPCHLVSGEYIPCAIAVEVNRGPYERAYRFVQAQGLSDKIEVRLGNGLSCLRSGEVGTVVIAGMGAQLVKQILTDNKLKLHTFRRLVLQPNREAGILRQWMLDSGWQLIDEELVWEKGHFYEILVAEQGMASEPYARVEKGCRIQRLLEIGPILWRKKHPLLRHKLKADKTKWNRVLNKLRQSSPQKSAKKIAQLERRIDEWEKMISCLSKENTSNNYSTGGSPHI